MYLKVVRVALRNSHYGIFHRPRTKNFTVLMEIQKTLNSQSSLEKEEWSWKNHILQSYSHQDSMVVAQKQKYKPMEQDRKPRAKPIHPWVPSVWQKWQEYTMGKR